MAKEREGYRHGASRRNNPTAESAVPAQQAKVEPKTYAKKKRSGRSRPELRWASERSRRITAPPLYIEEKIHPEQWIRSLRKNGPMSRSLFEEQNGFDDPLRAEHEWYEHTGHWSNRLISAASERAMASLLENEHMGGSVQMIYMDPPYGMDFDATFMTHVDDLDGAKGPVADTTSVQAFRDTYQNGIHSYLDKIEEHAELAHELLHDSGSLFVQIGDVNLHRVALILDRIFDEENRVTVISYATTGGGSSTGKLPTVTNYLLWYAKDISQMKYHQLFEKESVADWIKKVNFAAGVDTPDGLSRPLTAAERRNPDLLPKGSRLWRMENSTSQNRDVTGERSKPYNWKGIQFGPRGLENKQWKVSRLGLDRLAEKERLFSNLVGRVVESGTATQLHWKLYRDEQAGRRINNIWSVQSQITDKRYVVQTAEKTIERCMLMTTDPGDLVLDPTSGSGTTAVVAEEWGRRWVAIDASSVAKEVARMRILLRGYTMHVLRHSEHGWKEESKRRKEWSQAQEKRIPSLANDPAGGFVFARNKIVSCSILAYDKEHEVPPIQLVDRTMKRSRARIASAFTVETELLERFRCPDEIDNKTTRTGGSVKHEREDREWKERIVQALHQTPVMEGGGGNEWDIVDIEPWLGNPNELRGIRLGNRCTVVSRASGQRKKAGLLIAPQDCELNVQTIRRAVDDATRSIERAEILVCVALGFEAGTNFDNKRLGNLVVWRIQANKDLQLGHLKDDEHSQSFLVVAEPEVEVEKARGGGYTVRLVGWNSYDPIQEQFSFTMEEGNVQCWLVDTDFDRIKFRADFIHFPSRYMDGRSQKVLARIVGKDADMDALNAVFGTESRPFPTPTSGEIAVRVITRRGSSMTGIYEVD